MKLYILFSAAMLIQLIAGRTQLLAMRGQIRDTSGLLASLIGIASGISFFVLFVWGFASLPWYFVLGITLGIAMLCGLIVGRESFVFWYRARSLVDIIVVALTVFLWLTYWPFGN